MSGKMDAGEIGYLPRLHENGRGMHLLYGIPPPYLLFLLPSAGAKYTEQSDPVYEIQMLP